MQRIAKCKWITELRTHPFITASNNNKKVNNKLEKNLQWECEKCGYKLSNLCLRYEYYSTNIEILPIYYGNNRNAQ